MCATPGSSRAILLISRTTLSVRSSAGAVGKLRIENQIALVLFGNEADGHGLETEVGQPHQAGIDEQRDRADSQQARRPAGRRR